MTAMRAAGDDASAAARDALARSVAPESSEAKGVVERYGAALAGATSLRPHAASWKMTPIVRRVPERTRLTPCRIVTRWMPRTPRAGRWRTAKRTASP